MITAVSQTALFYVAGDRLSKTQLIKIDFSNSPLWHRWLQPLWAVKQASPAAFDHVKIASELATLDCGEAKSYRVKLLGMLRQHLAAATTKIDQDFYSSNDCLLYTSPSPRDATLSRMPSSA